MAHPDAHKPLELIRTTKATTYCFRQAVALGAWAHVTVNDETGDLQITSDWGNWSHTWYPPHLGSPSLTHFIGARDPGHVDYIAGKLEGSRGGTAFDFEESIAHLQRAVALQRLEDGRRFADAYPSLPTDSRPLLGKGAARDLWDELDQVEHTESPDLFYERLPDLWRHLRIDPSDIAKYTRTSASRFLREVIIPAIIRACAAEAARRNATSACESTSQGQQQEAQ